MNFSYITKFDFPYTYNKKIFKLNDMNWIVSLNYNSKPCIYLNVYFLNILLFKFPITLKHIQKHFQKCQYYFLIKISNSLNEIFTISIIK